MEDIISKIIDIEAQAQEIIKDAKAADENLDADIKTESDKLHKDIADRAAAKTVTIRQLEDGDAQKRIEEIRKKAETDIASLNEKYNKNKDEWAERIVSNIVG